MISPIFDDSILDSPIVFPQPRTILSCLKADIKNGVGDKDKILHMIHCFEFKNPKPQSHIIDFKNSSIPLTYHPFSFGSLRVTSWNENSSDCVYFSFATRLKIWKRIRSHKWTTHFKERVYCDKGKHCIICFPPPLNRRQKKSLYNMQELTDVY
jgi:hypothetical protein